MNRPQGKLGMGEAGRPPKHQDSGSGGGGAAAGRPPSLSSMDTPGGRAAGKMKVRRNSMKLIHTHMTQSPGAARPADVAQLNKLASEGITIVVIGASGDLAKKKTYPALMELYLSEFLPKHVNIVGYARSDMTDAALRQRLRPFLLEKTPGATEENTDEFLDVCTYHQGQYNAADSFSALHDKLMAYEQDFKAANRVYYLAVPTSVFVPALTAVNTAARAPNGWTRCIVEKPFGRDLKSCMALSEALRPLFKETELYRIDHYLGKEMVQNLAILRFANMWLEPLWNRNYIDSVTVTFKEDIGTMGRGGYFDNIGIIRDVMQNHLLQVLSVVAMEPPLQASGGDGNSFRDEKVKVLRSTEPLKLADTVVGQYINNGLDPDDEEYEPGYQEDETVPEGSKCYTFASTVFHINNSRWEGVPFIMKAGKALNERKAEVRIQFKDAPGATRMFGMQHLARNELVMRLQPNEAIYLKTNVKMPGLSSLPGQVEMDLSYKTRFPSMHNPDAYTRLILDVLRGKQSGFVRDDELEAAWKIFTPLLDELEKKGVEPIKYKFGVRGLKEADDLAKTHGFQVQAEQYQWVDPGDHNC